jgi:hypothetical protein
VDGRAERGIAMDDWTIRKAHGESIIPDAAAETDASAMAERGEAKGSTPPFNRFPTKVGDDWETVGPVMSAGSRHDGGQRRRSSVFRDLGYPLIVFFKGDPCDPSEDFDGRGHEAAQGDHVPSRSNCDRRQV